MNIDEYGKEFQRSLSFALIEAADLAAAEFTEDDLYAFCVLEVDDFEWVSACMNTRSHLAERFDLAKDLLSDFPGRRAPDEMLFADCELRCDEWVIPTHPLHGVFDEANDVLHRYKRQHEDEEEYWLRGRDVMLSAVVEAIRRLRSERPDFLDPTRVLTGIQVTDAMDDTIRDTVVKVSGMVNSPAWHAKYLQLLRMYREYDQEGQTRS